MDSPLGVGQCCLDIQTGGQEAGKQPCRMGSGGSGWQTASWIRAGSMPWRPTGPTIPWGTPCPALPLRWGKGLSCFALCQSSRSIGTLLSDTGFGWCRMEPGVGLRAPCGCLPTQDVCDYFSCSFMRTLKKKEKIGPFAWFIWLFSVTNDSCEWAPTGAGDCKTRLSCM